MHPAGSLPQNPTRSGWIREDDLPYYQDLYRRILENRTELLIPRKRGPFEHLIVGMIAELLQGQVGRQLVGLLAEFGSPEVEWLIRVDGSETPDRLDPDFWQFADDQSVVPPASKIAFDAVSLSPRYMDRVVSYFAGVHPREIVGIIETESGGTAARQAFTEFAHELIHALHDKLGVWGRDAHGDRDTVTEERQTVSGSPRGVISENDLLEEHGIPRRGDYYAASPDAITDHQRRAIDIAGLLRADETDPSVIAARTGIPVRDVEWLTIVVRRLGL